MENKKLIDRSSLMITAIMIHIILAIMMDATVQLTHCFSSDNPSNQSMTNIGNGDIQQPNTNGK
jgi:hypothetical protein